MLAGEDEILEVTYRPVPVVQEREGVGLDGGY